MNTQRHGLIATTLFASFVSALVLTTTQGSAQPDPGAPHPAATHAVQTLPRVVVTGRVQRMDSAAPVRVVDLPRVVVTGRRVAPVQSVAGPSMDRLTTSRS